LTLRNAFAEMAATVKGTYWVFSARRCAVTTISSRLERVLVQLRIAPQPANCD
jgi:hypothetical protein